jgi:hypothetical protein
MIALFITSSSNSSSPSKTSRCKGKFRVATWRQPPRIAERGTLGGSCGHPLLGEQARLWLSLLRYQRANLGVPTTTPLPAALPLFATGLGVLLRALRQFEGNAENCPASLLISLVVYGACQRHAP